MDLSQRIVTLRKQRKWTQEKLGELVNMSQRSVANWESGERCPSIPTLIDLSDKFNVSVDYMLGCSDVPEKAKEQRATDSTLLTEVISRLRDLPDPMLCRVSDFLAGMEAARQAAPAPADPDKGAASPAAPDPAGGPAE